MEEKALTVAAKIPATIEKMKATTTFSKESRTTLSERKKKKKKMTPAVMTVSAERRCQRRMEKKSKMAVAGLLRRRLWRLRIALQNGAT